MDIACGPADELTFLQNDPDVKIIATDISASVLSSENGIKNRLNSAGRKPGESSLVFASDVNLPAIAENSVDCGMLVNAVVYSPDKMLSAMNRALKPGAECSVNFRIFSNVNNKALYDYYLNRGGKILDKELSVATDKGDQIFNVKVLDYTECVNDDGTPDVQIRGLVQQIYFESKSDVDKLIQLTGFIQESHSQFEFHSPVNPKNQIDVFILKKPMP